ncbi:glucosaminidase domain-containing protein [Paenibacillus methanolicus]|uniref:Mannosyl-glycoprotein endo-beta-N-acetylglucosaminidase n=1 Tax=Paenibacillus methanolicus TaxID=582686 RepID=A0A5S5CI36_9BACL|nr:glucosaminidase domain-containing protein [Paenibacillus methanolicus]TYP79456.1 mannosyl-glycoprotein endo-beta-N-acetylglucosaminidase [Paenibacillus methanolicus]
MRKKRLHFSFLSAISVVLLLSMGMTFVISHNRVNSKEAIVSSEAVRPVALAAPTSYAAQAPAILGASTANSAQAAAQPRAEAGRAASSSGATAAASSAKPSLLNAKTAAAAPVVYRVTAYYLNVRANGYSTSKILGTVKQGTELRVEKVTDKGWLRLEGGGYVHGGYAKPVGASAQTAAAVLKRPAAVTKTDAMLVKAAPAKPAVMRLAPVKPAKPSEPSQPKSLVKSVSGLSVAHIAEIFENTALEGHGLEEEILAIEAEYGINAYFTIAVMKLESGNGKSKIAKNKNNLFGLNAIDGDRYNKALKFETKRASVRKFGQLISKSYIGKGYTTIEKIARKYCPANPKWPSLVTKIMKADYRKL